MSKRYIIQEEKTKKFLVYSEYNSKKLHTDVHWNLPYKDSEYVTAEMVEGGILDYLKRWYPTMDIPIEKGAYRLIKVDYNVVLEPDRWTPWNSDTKYIVKLPEWLQKELEIKLQI